MRYLFEATELTKTNYGRNEHTNIRKNIKHGGLSYYIYRLEVSVIICIRESAVEALCFVLFLILNTVHTMLCLLIWMDGWMDRYIFAPKKSNKKSHLWNILCSFGLLIEVWIL